MDTKNAQDERESFTDYEKIYLHMSRAFAHIGKEHWGLHCVCEIECEPAEGVTVEGALQQAWAQLLIEYPGLGTRPDGWFKNVIDLSQNATVAEWLRLTFVVETDRTADDITAAAQPRELPGLYYLPSSSEVILLSQHWRTDALGCCILLDRLFELLAANASSQPVVLSKTNTTSPAMEIAADSIDAEDSDTKEFARKYIDAFHEKAVHSGGLPYRGDHTTTPTSTRHRELILGPSDTNAVVQACRRYNISVSAACHVALAHTVLAYTPDEQKSQGYTTVMAVNMRPHLPPPYNTKAHACQTYVASITPTVSGSDTFLSSASALTQEYKTWFHPKLLRSLRWIYRFHYDRTFNTPPKPGRLPPSGVTLSSLGVIERQLKQEYGSNLKVKGFRFGVGMMTRQTLLYVWTFRGRLTFSLDYNEAYHSEEQVREVLERIRDGVLAGCQLLNS